jgi:formate dehydrogenase major subunit/formate dehydrogenase alpha subunit
MVIGKDIVQSSGSSYKLLLLSAINYLANGRIYLLSERANEQGSIDMGCLPDMLPGCRPVSMPEFRNKYESVWRAEIPELPGRNIFEIFEAAESGDIKALYVMGENPACNLPDSNRIASVLEKLDFLVVQDIFMTETAKHADVVLPSLAWAEKDGTYTNMERRIQRVRKAVQREGMSDWKITAEIAKNMGYDMSYSKAEDVFHEIARVSPLHRDLIYQDIENGENIYPYKGEPLRDMREEIAAVRSDISAEDGRLYLGIERPLFHSGTLSTHAPAMLNIYPRPVVRISARHAGTAGIKDGDIVRVTSGRGTLELPAVISNDSEMSSAMICNNFDGRNSFRLAGTVLDPVTKAPCLDQTEITIEKVKS